MNNNSLVVSHLTLRTIVGCLAVSFPFLLYLVGLIIYEEEIQRTVSNYYHTDVRDIFVGVLCVIGIVLFAYKGYEISADESGLLARISDNVAGNVAGFSAIAVALFPSHLNQGDTGILGVIHAIFAALFFVSIIFFSLVLFPKTNATDLSRGKQERNKVYRICGWIMIVCIALIVVFNLLPTDLKDNLASYTPVFWLESIAIVTFGISWLTKVNGIASRVFRTVFFTWVGIEQEIPQNEETNISNVGK